ncbi:unnamed protein product, partial [marine sediment metagenome]
MKYYFKHSDSKIRYKKTYFNEYMKDNSLTEIEVFEAVKERITDVFWCKIECLPSEDSADTCGKQCINYEPRNGKS